MGSLSWNGLGGLVVGDSFDRLFASLRMDCFDGSLQSRIAPIAEAVNGFFDNE